MALQFYNRTIDIDISNEKLSITARLLRRLADRVCAFLRITNYTIFENPDAVIREELHVCRVRNTSIALRGTV